MSSWPANVARTFRLASEDGDPSGKIATVYNGPFVTLLHGLFPPNSRFQVTPFRRQPQESRGKDDFAMTYVVRHQHQNQHQPDKWQLHPILIIQVDAPFDLLSAEKREEAEAQMKSFIDVIKPRLRIPTLHGVCAFGEKLVFYEYSTANGQVTRLAGGAVSLFEKDAADRLKKIAKDAAHMSHEIKD